MISVVITDRSLPPVLETQTIQVQECVASSVSFGKVSASDFDSEENLIFQMKEDLSNKFGINSENGELFLLPGIRLDYETLSLYSITVFVMDTKGLTADAIVNLEVQDCNEQPVINSSQVTIHERYEIGDLVFQLFATDEDNGDSMTFVLEPLFKDIVDPFKVNNTSTGEVTLTVDLLMISGGVRQYDLEYRLQVIDSKNAITVLPKFVVHVDLNVVALPEIIIKEVNGGVDVSCKHVDNTVTLVLEVMFNVFFVGT
eukprot:TRINITY_DN3312_c0_g1_i5.p1 TRINITY_DN3312_c0_g1~~TRINITY_DN3312_c0_g1_i5.p1  ORF type:complete len:257 (+),score=79.83 TRINITY_DN3312_c0_g1_i5:302-1072(+)